MILSPNGTVVIYLIYSLLLFSQDGTNRESGKKVIQDRTIYEDAHIFAPNLYAMGLMTNRDFLELLFS
jgi:deoxyadenosine/deoxycytidine kinase